jgi:hypothetical protein
MCMVWEALFEVRIEGEKVVVEKMKGSDDAEEHERGKPVGWNAARTETLRRLQAWQEEKI